MKSRLLLALLVVVTLGVSLSKAGIPTMQQNDPWPIYSTFYPMSILNVQRKLAMEKDAEMTIKERFQISVLPYGQKATYARDEDKSYSLLGDVHGRLNMIGLMYGDIPMGQSQAPLLTTASLQDFANPPLATTSIADPAYTDDKHQFGFFSQPLKYRKVGVRAQFAARFLDDFVFMAWAGAADLRQTFSGLTDLTPASLVSDVYPAGSSVTQDEFKTDQATVEKYLMEPYREIFKELDVSANTIQQSGAEDVTLLLNWIHNFPVNKNRNPEEWSYFVFSPFIQFGGTLGAAKATDPTKLYDLSLGNNRHNAIQINGGFCLDFADSIEIDVQGGIAHFFSRTSLQRVPTSTLQSTLYPYMTEITRSPGNTWFIALGTTAYQFLDKLSAYVQYVYTAHLTDTIELVMPDPAFIPERLAQDSPYKVQVANFGFTYDISPNFVLGLAVQYPLARRGAYRTTDIALDLSLIF